MTETITVTDISDLPTIAVQEALQSDKSASSISTPQPDGENAPEGDYGSLESDEARIKRLASLNPMQYDRVRKEEAKALRIRSETLDKRVRQARGGGADETPFEEVEPWLQSVDPAQLLSEIAASIRRFIICEPETAHASALWVAMTWFMEVVEVAPLAVITAPEKRCGKSQLLFLLGRMVRRPLPSSNITPAALFRSIHAWAPTLLIDEADAFMRENEELRGLLNCGHTRESAYVVRVVGDDHKPTRFNVWGAKALAGIGHLADTLMDRSITLELRRKLPHEQVDRLRHAEAGLFDTIRAKLARFADDYAEAVRVSRPDLPTSLNDRAQDNWEPLLAIAEVAGGVWPETARAAALKLAADDSTNQSIGVELLADIREVFELKQVDKLATVDLLNALIGDELKPWATYNRGKEMKPRQLAKRLGEYGIQSHDIRFKRDGVRKGYDLVQFQDTFGRYLSLSPNIPPVSATTLQTNNGVVLDVADNSQRCVKGIASATPKPAWTNACSVVADKKGGVCGLSPEPVHEPSGLRI